MVYSIQLWTIVLMVRGYLEWLDGKETYGPTHPYTTFNYVGWTYM